MGQVTIYLTPETEKKLRQATRASKMSRSKWVARLIHEKLSTNWPPSIVELAGAWSEPLSAEECRKNLGEDIPREPL